MSAAFSNFSHHTAGPKDVAILLQAGLTSAMKSSTVVQLNQRMLLDLMASQPNSFASAVLAEIGTPGGQGSCRGLTSGKSSMPHIAVKVLHFHSTCLHFCIPSLDGFA